ncbi:hypothetical protein HYPSUDRAFT_208173 [Hypholoma sublateritium FD-334 SS-4]|uniref:Uncharacterized protein n=1 Tax=Hypholoma sublateritium (strain FD-334 SS-4) TaxID=945553 RepID=A0A0D2N7N6_HYPSF|nr:hypothetical protein HYPSUDRAFT_208173 [Hypholoma sublateritium FD-334 SS-4]
MSSNKSKSTRSLEELHASIYFTSQIKDLVDQVVNNRNPNGRAGCALAFGSIYSHVVGLATGPLLMIKTAVNVLISLINDTHYVVHFRALNALARVIDAASLAYAPMYPALASINALYQLVQKDALSMLKLGGDQLVGDLFGMLDDDSSVRGARNVISSWLQQTVIYNPSAWIDLCQRIMARRTASQQVADAATRQDLRDDEVESLNAGLSQDSKAGGRSHLTSRWRTQLFALQCLHEICVIVANSERRKHLDTIVARAQGIPSAGLLFSRVSDLIKMDFTASTAYVRRVATYASE